MAQPTATSPRTNPSHATLHNFHVNVKMFGAVGNGVADDSTAIQSAMNAGFNIFFPAGTYKLNSTLTLPNHWMILEGAGAGRTIIQPAAGIAAFTINAARFSLKFRDFHIIGTDTTSTGFTCSGAGLQFGAEFYRVWFTTLAYAINTNATSYEFTGSRFLRCEFENAPVKIDSINNVSLWQACRWSGCTQNKYAVELTRTIADSVNNAFVDCIFESNDRGAIRLERQVGVNFRNCYWENNNTDLAASTPWVDLVNATTSRVNFFNCVFSSPGVAHIGVGSSDASTHSGIAFYNCNIGANLSLDTAAWSSYTDLGRSTTGPGGIASAFIKGDFEGPYITTNDAAYTLAKFRLGATGTPIAQPIKVLGQDGTTVLAAIRSNGAWQGAVVATGSLPAASAAMDGTILVEDGGAGNRNLIIYGGGQRFRIDGGAAI